MNQSKIEANIRDRRRPAEDLEKSDAKVPKHDEKIRQVADQYASSKGLKLQHDMPPVKVDQERAKKIASAYQSMPHDPNHPDVQNSYNALISETSDQLHHMKNAGMKFSKIKPGQENPYKNGSKELLHDIRNNNHMWYYPTESGFGSKESVFGPSGNSAHPMLRPTEHKDDEGNNMPANDVFRIVHDYFGHGKEGHGFGPTGEEGAWRHHRQMFSPAARPALTAETRGQNSWVNFGPHAEHNRKNPAQTIYADQKAGLLPDWANDTEDTAHKLFGKAEPLQKKEPLAVGIHQDYKKNARKQCGVSFPVKIKGRSTLSDEINLHMSLKCFNSKDEFTIPELVAAVKELDIDKPDLSGATFKPTIFTNDHTNNTYYMLVIEGLDPKYKKFADKFKDVGVTHKKFMSHITIDKKLYDQIRKDGITADDLEFSGLILEHGAGNRLHTFAKSEVLEKGHIKSALAALGVAGGLVGGSMPNANPAPSPKPKAQIQQRAPAAPQKPANTYSSQRMLNTISAVESSGGKNTHHGELGGMHHGESAFGKYGLTPVVIRDTVRMNHDLNNKHKKVLGLQGDDLHRYMEDNPGLEDQVAQRHLARIEHHFGKDPATIGYAWLQGVTGTYKAKRERQDIANHWHARKISEAYKGN